MVALHLRFRELMRVRPDYGHINCGIKTASQKVAATKKCVKGASNYSTVNEGDIRGGMAWRLDEQDHENEEKGSKNSRVYSLMSFVFTFASILKGWVCWAYCWNPLKWHLRIWVLCSPLVALGCKRVDCANGSKNGSNELSCPDFYQKEPVVYLSFPDKHS